MTLFDHALRWIFEIEGGVNPDDHGSPSVYGIRRANHPTLPWPPSREAAAAVYRTDYWDAIRCGLLPPMLALSCFDFHVNGGPCVTTLQRLLGVPEDGVIGPVTSARAHAVDQVATLTGYLARRVRYYTTLETWAQDWLAWSDRLFRLHRACLALPLADLVPEGADL